MEFWLAELVLNENLKEAFIIGVDELAKERLNRLTASNKVTPVDLENLSQQLQQTKNKEPAARMVKNQELVTKAHHHHHHHHHLNDLAIEEELQLNTFSSSSISSGGGDCLIQIKNTGKNPFTSSPLTSTTKKRPAPLAPSATSAKASEQQKMCINVVEPSREQHSKPMLKLTCPSSDSSELVKVQQPSSLSSSTKSNKSGFSALSTSSSLSSEVKVTKDAGKLVIHTAEASEVKAAAGNGNCTSDTNYCSTSSVSSSSSASVSSPSSSSPPSPPPSSQLPLPVSDKHHHHHHHHHHIDTDSSPIAKHSYYNNITYDEDEFVHDDLLAGHDIVLLDQNDKGREMAIDCPESFVPEVKTKPCYPPFSVPPFSTARNEEQQPVLTPKPVNTKNNILKPLLTIIKGDSDSSDHTSKTQKKAKNKKQAAKTEAVKQVTTGQQPAPVVKLVPPSPEKPVVAPVARQELSIMSETLKTNEDDQQALIDQQASRPLTTGRQVEFSAESSMRFIDEDTKSRIVGLSQSNFHDSPMSKFQGLLAAESNAQVSGKVSLGKKLFEKQRQNVDSQLTTASNQPAGGDIFGAIQIPSTNANDLNQYKELFGSAAATGVVNNCFEMDDDEEQEEDEDKKLVSSLEFNFKLDTAEPVVSKPAVVKPCPPPRSDKPGVVQSLADEKMAPARDRNQSDLSSSSDHFTVDSGTASDMGDMKHNLIVPTKTIVRAELEELTTGQADQLTTKSQAVLNYFQSLDTSKSFDLTTFD